MKKVLTILLVLGLLAAIAVPAWAANTAKRKAFVLAGNGNISLTGSATANNNRLKFKIVSEPTATVLDSSCCAETKAENQSSIDIVSGLEGVPGSVLEAVALSGNPIATQEDPNNATTVTGDATATECCDSEGDNTAKNKACVLAGNVNVAVSGDAEANNNELKFKVISKPTATANKGTATNTANINVCSYVGVVATSGNATATQTGAINTVTVMGSSLAQPCCVVE